MLLNMFQGHDTVGPGGRISRIKAVNNGNLYLYKHSFYKFSSKVLTLQSRSCTTSHMISCCYHAIVCTVDRTSLFFTSPHKQRGSRSPISKSESKKKYRLCAQLDVASAVDVINDLGLDTLTFLASTVLIVPAFRTLKASPVRSPWFFLTKSIQFSTESISPFLEDNIIPSLVS